MGLIMDEHTLVIIKPDAQERGLIGRIISRFEDKYLRVTGALLTYKDEEWYEAMYPHLHNYPDNVFEKNRDFLLTSPLLGLVISGPEAVKVVKRIATSIRDDYATIPQRYNCIHSSDPGQAEKEITLFFGENDVESD
jgi:nucleoside-diphosphate kinase